MNKPQKHKCPELGQPCLSRDEARARKAALKTKLNVYECPFCSFYHLKPKR